MKIYKKLIFAIALITLVMNIGYSQEDRIDQLRLKLESIEVDTPGLNERADINVSNILLPDFLRILTNAHEVNINISSDINTITFSNNFSNASVSEILIFLCKEFELDIDFMGNILSIHKLVPDIIPYQRKEIPIVYNQQHDLLSVNLDKDTLSIVFKDITDKSGRNLVFAPGLGNQLLTSYIQNMPFETAIENIAFGNNLIATKTRDNYYLFESSTSSTQNTPQGVTQKRPYRNRRSNFYFKINDTLNKTLDVDFENTSISSIVYDISQQLNLNTFTAAPIDAAGVTTVKADNISVDLLFDKILENTEFTFKKEGSIYFFGKRDQASLRSTEIIPLRFRSIEILSGQTPSSAKKRTGSLYTNTNYYGGSNYNNGSNGRNQNGNRQPVNTNGSNFQNYDTKAEALISILPDEIKNNLDIQTDIELNSFIVSGPDQDIEKFREFIKYIDKPIPNVNIEVMFVEVNKSATIETGITWGIGEQAAQTKGTLGPAINMTLGAGTINNIINAGTFGSLNLGNVVPEFYVNIKAMEANGDIKVRSTPKISALSGHMANFSIGETTYYAVTERNIYGSQNPQTSEITNYFPIDAETAINIKPIVTADGSITMEINVVQSTFNGIKIDENAPPGINSREFTSIVRVQDQNLIVLGGLERVTKSDSGNGVPILSRIPIIKWLFSSRKREDTKKKLVVFIKPTIIY